MSNCLHRIASALAAVLLLSAHFACSPQDKSRRDAGTQVAQNSGPTSAPTTQPIDPVIARIREEGLNHSKVMDTLDYLCDVIGQRLTGSPSCTRASAWTRDTLASWGLANAHLEAWGPFGRGWEVKRFSLQVVSPYTIVLAGYPKAWSPGFQQPLEAPVMLLDAAKESELEPFKGKLKGAIVLLGKPRDLQPRFEPLASRMQDAELTRMADARTGANLLMGQARAETASERQAQFAASGALGERLVNRRGGATSQQASSEPSSQPTTRPRFGGRRAFDPFASRALKFAADEGALLVITTSTTGDGGTFVVQSASIPGDTPFGSRGGSTTNASTNPTNSTTNPATAVAATTGPATGPSTRPRVWATNAPSIPPQVTLAVEDYNRLARMLKQNQPVTMAVDMQVCFYDDDPMVYNTIAEIPGSDPQLKDQIVMVGAHLDSWHSGTGATDNGVGCAAAMEALRIINALDLHPRRTIRVALWTGEEQGIFGSTAYVKQHFGYDPQRERDRAAGITPRPIRSDDSTAPESSENNPATEPATRGASRSVVKLPDYEKLSVYFNLDNGTGKIRGVYAQGNEAAMPIFSDWLAPFSDLGANTITIANTGSTDHISFDQVGLPGFQFIQDPIEYMSRTHHTNQDVYDRAQADDLKQASTILAAFLWNAAQMDERFPRKP